MNRTFYNGTILLILSGHRLQHTDIYFIKNEKKSLGIFFQSHLFSRELIYFIRKRWHDIIFFIAFLFFID